jgi:predicted permease
VLSFGVTFPAAFGSEPPTALREHFREITENLESIPGVVAASMVDAPLPIQGDDDLYFWLDGEPKLLTDSDMHWAKDMGVQPGFARVMQVPVLKGRFISEEDTASSPQVVVIDEVLARKYFPHVDPIGKRLNIAFMDTRWVIVGIVGHTKESGLAESDSESVPQVYYALRQKPDRFIILDPTETTYVVRTRGEPLSMVNAIGTALKKMNSHLSVYAVLTLDSIVDDSVASQRFTMYFLAVFAALAVLLASIGVYGVISYVVGQRSREIGLRVALGASRSDVLRLVLREGILISGLGVSIGILASAGMTRLLSKMLFGISAHDPLTFSAVTILLTVVAVCASCSPAIRAMRLDPVTTLRHE